MGAGEIGLDSMALSCDPDIPFNLQESTKRNLDVLNDFLHVATSRNTLQ